MNEVFRVKGDSLPLSLEKEIDADCLRFEKAWQEGGRPAIEPYLAEAPPEARGALLRELLALELAYRRRAGETLDPDDYRRRFPEHSTLLAQALAAEPPALGPANARYRPLRPHARGGLGEVQVAFDVELRREVALKRIQGRYAHDPEVRRRFLREAEITGRLEHPGIVPVYGLVHDADGQPCYAMRFIEGQTLQDAIRRFHAADGPGRETAEQRLALRELLGRFVAVCNTVAYAHSRGVLHRDLKPANVMLGKFGETVVVDWGLAKRIGRDGTEQAGEAGEQNGAATGETEPGTLPGLAAGTPAYMSPEQAAGDWDRVGPASDVYSLGATLHEILVNRPPSAETNRDAVSPTVPKALEAVCLKALAHKPEHRYATATELAGEVERWLADEPVTAYREPWSAKARRWLRRRRLLVSGGVAALVMLAISLAVGASLLGAANAQLRQRTMDLADEQVRTEEALRAEAERRKQAREALDAQTSLVMEDLLSRREEMPEELQRFLRQAVESYERFVADTGQEEESRAGVAKAHFRVGNIHQRLGQAAESNKAYQQAIGKFEQLAAEYPDSATYRRDLATCKRYLADLLHGQDAPAAARAEYGKARAAYEEAIPVLEQRARAFPDRLEYSQDVANTYNDLGIVLYRLEQWAAARSAYERGVAIQERLAEMRPDKPVYRQDLAKGHYNIGLLLWERQALPASRSAYEQSVRIRKQLVADFPKTTAYQRDLVSSYNNLGLVLHKQGDLQGARKAQEDALALRKQLARQFPSAPYYQYQLAGTCDNLGNVLRGLKSWKEAQSAYEQAAAVRKQWMQSSPALPSGLRSQAITCNNLGNVLRQQEQWEAAGAAYRESVAWQTRLIQAAPAESFTAELAVYLNNLGALAADKGKPSEALEWHDKAIGALEAARAKGARGRPVRLQLRDSFGQRAEALGLLNRHAEAAKDWARAGEHNPEPPRAAELRWQRALSLARAGEHVQAVAAANELAAAKGASPDTLYACARVYSIASTVVKGDVGLQEQYSGRAGEMLRMAIDAGYKDVEQLKKDKDLDVIRGREDVQRLLRRVGK